MRWRQIHIAGRGDTFLKALGVGEPRLPFPACRFHSNRAGVNFIGLDLAAAKATRSQTNIYFLLIHFGSSLGNSNLMLKPILLH